MGDELLNLVAMLMRSGQPFRFEPRRKGDDDDATAGTIIVKPSPDEDVIFRFAMGPSGHRSLIPGRMGLGAYVAETSNG